MLRWAAIFLIVAIVAAIMGFAGIAGPASGLAMVLCWAFLAICVVLFLVGITGGDRPY